MEIRSKTLAIIIAFVIFGGIVGASALGLWTTEGVRNPARLLLSESVGETGMENAGTGAYDPAGIRGNHSFGEISELFNIPLEILSQAFALPAEVDPVTFQNQDFETIYPDFGGELEIGNGSMKWFVALYTGLPFELEDDEEATFLLRPAVDILKNHANLTTEQIAYLDAHSIEIDFEWEPVEISLPTGEAESEERKQDLMLVAGKTSFADLLEWGVSVEQIEAIIGGEIPNHLVLVYDYCQENELSFGGIKTVLQAEVDQLTP